MSSISCARNLYVRIAANCINRDARLISAAAIRKVVQLFAVVLTAAALAACAQSSVVTNKSELLVASRQTALEDNRNASFMLKRRVSGTRCVNRSCAPNKPRPLSLSPNNQQANKHLVG